MNENDIVKDIIRAVGVSIAIGGIAVGGGLAIDKAIDIKYARQNFQEICSQYNLTPEQAKAFIDSATSEYAGERYTRFVPFSDKKNANKLSKISIKLDRKLSAITNVWLFQSNQRQ